MNSSFYSNTLMMRRSKMDRALASKEHPLLNQGLPYIPDAGRTDEDDIAMVWDAGTSLRGRTHMTQSRFNSIYHNTMRFFTEQEKYAFRQYQTGERKPEDFYREVSAYLKKAFPAEMSNENDFNEMMKRIDLAMFQYDVIQPLIDQEETSDIKICSPTDIRVRIKGKAYKSNATFMDEHDLLRFVEGLSYRNQVDIYGNAVCTFTDDHDKNYLLRFTVSAPFVNNVDYPYLHIRKVPKSKPDFDELIHRGMLNEELKLYLIDRAKASRGIVFAGPPGCVDRETEFFNGSEWKSIANWDNEKVLQYDTNTGIASLVMPSRYIKEPCDFMYHFETKYGINQTLSPEHRVLYKNRTRKNGKKIWSDDIKEISAEELSKLQNSGKFYGGFITTFDYAGSGIDLTDVEIRLMLAVIADGTFKNEYCTINIKKQRKKEELHAILAESKIEYTYHEYPNGYARFRFIAPRKEKEFTSYWYHCNRHQLELICENVLKWDGSIDNKNKRRYTSTSKKSIDFIQFVFSACGYRATIKTNDRRNETHKSIDYDVIISDNNIVGMAWHNDGRDNNVKLEPIQPEDGYKYCFTVPTHALVLRRNGKIFVTGNSGKTTALNAFIEYIPKTRETLVIQENDELYTEQSGFMFKHPTHGFHGEPIVTLEDLGKMALVEGCNEFIIGEVKGGEMRYAMTLINAGGNAALTVHSTNAYETLEKMADLVKYGSSYTLDEARRMLKTFDTVVYMEGYKIQEILEVDGFNDETKQYNYINIYRFGA